LQSYVDLSLLAIIAGGVLLLVLELVLFILSARRCGRLERENARLTQEFSEYKNSVSSKLETVAVLERKLQAEERTVSYLTDNHQQITEKQLNLLSEIDQIKSRIEQQNKLIDEHSPDAKPIFEAKKLLNAGESLDSIAEKTGLPRNELEMLSSVHSAGSRNEKQPAAAVSKAAAKDTESKPITSNHIAGLKARNAYGIPASSASGAAKQHSTLRRAR